MEHEAERQTGKAATEWKQKKQSQFEDEEWLTYKTRQKEKPLNEEPGAFYSTVFEGINSQKSVFDKSALFHTGQEG